MMRFGWRTASQVKPAMQALSLKDDMVFKLLLVMTMLLGWIAGVVAGGLVGLENAYTKWQLDQGGKVSVYLMPETSDVQVEELLRQMRLVPEVRQVAVLRENEVRQLLQPYFSGDSFLPLPVVVEAKVSQSLNRLDFEKLVKDNAPGAEIDDARDLLSRVAAGVRTVQGVSVVLALVVLVIMAMLVSLTVRAGLRGQRRSMRMMQLLGATDAFMMELVVRQVFRRSLVGWFGASVLSVFTLAVATVFWQPVLPYMTPVVWVGVVSVPLLLVAVSVVVSLLVTRHVIREQVV